MSYIGNTPADLTSGDAFIVNNFVAGVGFTAGSSTTITLTFAPSTEQSVIISFDGVTQHHDTYSIIATTVTFDTAIPTGTANVEAQFYKSTVVNTIADGSVTSPKLGTGAIIGTNIQAFDTDTAKTDVVQTFTVSQRGGVTDHGTLIANTAFRQSLSASNHYKMTLGGNITINNPTNQVAGQSGAIEIVNGGSYTVSWGSDWDFSAGTAPVITASGTDLLSYYVSSANNIVVDALQNLS